MGRPEGRQRKRNYKDWPGQGIEEEEKRRGPSDGTLPRCSRQRTVVGGQRRGGQRRVRQTSLPSCFISPTADYGLVEGNGLTFKITSDWDRRRASRNARSAVFSVSALSDLGHSMLPSHLKEVADALIFFYYYQKGLEPGPRWETEGKSRMEASC